MRRITVKVAVVVVLVFAAALIAGAVSAQAFPPGLMPTRTSPVVGPTQTPPMAGPTQTALVVGPTQAFPTPTRTPSGPAAITSGPGSKGFPAISGDTIAWIENDTMSVTVYDASSGESRTVTGNDTYALVSARQVDVSGDTVVWAALGAATMSPDIYLYDTATGSVDQITNDPAIQMWPCVSENVVCWNNIDPETERGEIYWYNSETEAGDPLMRNATFIQLYPAIGGDTVAWLDDARMSGHLDLNWASISSGNSMRASTTGNITSMPAVSSDGSRVVWTAEENGTYVLSMLDVGTKSIEQITDDGALPLAPAVDGNYVVWTDYRNGNGDIYLYDIRSGQERQVTSSSAEQVFPDISGERIVWMGNDDGPWNVYLGSAGAGPQPTGRASPGPTAGPIFPTQQPTYGPVYPTGYPAEGPTWYHPTEDWH